MKVHTIYRDDMNLEESGFTKIDDEGNEVPIDSYEELYDCLRAWLSDEKCNLDETVDGCIVAFADMGLWNGRRDGGRVYGDNVSDIFDVGYDFNNFYCDSYNVRASLTHHDGTHYLLFRVASSREEAERLVEAIAYNGMTEETFRKRTRSLRPYVAKVFGW